MGMTATCRAHPNIALVKYWGRRPGSPPELNLPATGSFSMTMGGVHTTTTVSVEPTGADVVLIDGKPAERRAYDRVVAHLDRMRASAKSQPHLRVVSQNNFPQGSGLASSASAFAALTVAANEVLGLGLSGREMSVVARQGSGSAARSLFGGWVLWNAGSASEGSYADQIEPPSHLPVVDLVALVSRAHKKVGSGEGHGLADTSPLHAARVASVAPVLDEMLAALARKDLARMGELAERDALAMHGVMMTSSPSLLYWEPGTVEILHAVRAWRAEGLRCWFTIDAGPNVHVLCHGDDAPRVQAKMRALGYEGDRLLACPPGPGPTLLREHLSG
ncbi:MAG TPA: diphosphomevalonate decarboxylase [Candidatus Thermoplasmatota archaeon]|nr:diphosphomevalonate decarboxylase [Candidatus Thermoplasmatota archaeon]